MKKEEIKNNPATEQGEGIEKTNGNEPDVFDLLDTGWDVSQKTVRRLKELLDDSSPEVILGAAKELRWWMDAVYKISPSKERVHFIKGNDGNLSCAYLVSLILAVASVTVSIMLLLR